MGRCLEQGGVIRGQRSRSRVPPQLTAETVQILTVMVARQCCGLEGDTVPGRSSTSDMASVSSPAKVGVPAPRATSKPPMRASTSRRKAMLAPTPNGGSG